MTKRHFEYDLKVRAVKAVMAGTSIESVSRSFNVDRSTIHRWLQVYRETRKISSLKPKARTGRPRITSAGQARKLERDLRKPASKFGFETDLWTCRRVMQHAKKVLRVKISQPTMWRRLTEAGLSYQKPEKRFFEGNLKLKESWLKNDLPKIQRAVLKYRAILYFEDEASISLAPVLGKTWSPIGETPIQRVTGKRGSISAMSAISKSGHLIFTLPDERIKSQHVIEFLSQMLEHHPRRHLVVVMDQARPHVSKVTKEFIGKHKRLHVFYLPPYSPEFNPDEKVWNHLKNEELKGHQAKDRKELKIIARKKLRLMAKDPELLRGIFFRCYIAKLMN